MMRGVGRDTYSVHSTDTDPPQRDHRHLLSLSVSAADGRDRLSSKKRQYSPENMIKLSVRSSFNNNSTPEYGTGSRTARWNTVGHSLTKGRRAGSRARLFLHVRI
jgi:hypothetical protein